MEEMSFLDLRCKEIVNELDGRKLGRVTDLIFSLKTGCVLGLVAPYYKRTFFFKGQDVFIPLKNIIKIGPDVILVRLTPQLSRFDGCHEFKHEEKKEEKHHHHDPCHNNHHHDPCHDPCHDKKDDKKGDCDSRCEKCMLFDCSRRWSRGFF